MPVIAPVREGGEEFAVSGSRGVGAGVSRVMGLESEYGIHVPGDPVANPMIASGLVVRAYADRVGPADGLRVARWDYAGESPLADSRGWTLQRDLADESMLTDEWRDDVRIANCVTPNGARLYVDHAHPEYSGAECLAPREVITWDRAGEAIAARAAAAITPDELAAASARGTELVLYKNNTDGKGASYGTHENYLVDRAVPFEDIVDGLIPFFVVRQVITGAGRVGLGTRSERAGFQIGARSDFMEALVGLETTFLRPLVNTRDEPHSDRTRFRRLHVILGDANMCDVPNLLKVGMTSLVLGLIEAGRAPAGLELDDPLAEVRAVSRDLTLSHRLTLKSGSSMTALEILRRYHAAASAWVDEMGTRDEATAEVLDLWDEVLVTAEGGPAALAPLLDWAAKWALLERYRARDGWDWDAPTLAAIDLQWADLRPGKGLARALERAGRIRRLTNETEVGRACVEPPPSTRAFLRGMCVGRFPEAVAASWESIAFGLPGSPRLACPDPRDGARADVADILASVTRAADLVAALAHLGR